MIFRCVFFFVLGGLVVGCASPPGGFSSPVPSKRMDAAIEAAANNDRTAIPHLILMLESDDPLVRMVAIGALERLTGEERGYDHAAPAWERQSAIDRWPAWAHEGAFSADSHEAVDNQSEGDR